MVFAKSNFKILRVQNGSGEEVNLETCPCGGHWRVMPALALRARTHHGSAAGAESAHAPRRHGVFFVLFVFSRRGPERATLVVGG